MEIDRFTTRIEGVTFVSVLARNPHEQAARFRLENALDGPVLPPRTRGRPEAGWDDTGYEGILAAEATAGLGYASPAEPETPPAVLSWVEPAGEELETDTERPDRQFADPRPPRSVLSPAAPVLRTGRPDPGDAVGPRSRLGADGERP